MSSYFFSISLFPLDNSKVIKKKSHPRVLWILLYACIRKDDNDICLFIMYPYILSSVLGCSLRFPHKTMFGSSLPPVVCRRARVFHHYIQETIRRQQTHNTICVGHHYIQETIRRQQTHNTICVGHHYAQTNTDNVNKTRACFLYIVVSNSYCVVFLFFFVLCILCTQFLRLVYPMYPVALDCFYFVCLRLVYPMYPVSPSCVSYVPSFSVLCILCTQFKTG
jgi:hypothetical protein